MTARHRTLFFLLAMVAMICLAAASASMALKHTVVAILFFVLAFALIGTGFTARRRVTRK